MIKNLTNRQFFYLYLGAVALGFILVFNIAIKPTLELRRECKQKASVLTSVSTAPQQIKLINKRLAKINSHFSSLSMNENTSRDKILEEVGNYCSKNRISVHNYPELHLYHNNTFTVESNRIVVKGDFKRLLKLVNFLETKAEFGRIVSLGFSSETNRKTKRKELYLELIFQNIRNNE